MMVAHARTLWRRVHVRARAHQRRAGAWRIRVGIWSTQSFCPVQAAQDVAGLMVLVAIISAEYSYSFYSGTLLREELHSWTLWSVEK